MARYAVASGNWNSTSVWSASSGGLPGASVPTNADDVIFNAASGNITVTITLNSVCRQIDCTGFTGTAKFDTGSGIFLTIGTGGNFASVVKWFQTTHQDVTTFAFNKRVVFNSTSTGNTILTQAGFGFPTVEFDNTGTWALQDTLACCNLNMKRGTLQNNGHDILTGTQDFIGDFVANWGTAATLSLSGGTLYLDGNLLIDSNITLTGGNKLDMDIVWQSPSSTFQGDGRNYKSLTIIGAHGGISGAHGGDIWSITGANTFDVLAIKDNVTDSTHTGITLRLFADQTVTDKVALWGNGFGQATGNSPSRILFKSNLPGTARTVTVTSNIHPCEFIGVDFEDITAAGTGGSWAPTGISTSMGDAGGNTGITFTTPVTRYWVGGTGNWSSTSHWSASSGGGSGATVPLPQDTVNFDANSFSAGSQTVTIDMPRIGKTINFTGVTNTPTLALANASIFGSLTLVSGMTLSGSATLTFEGRSSYTLTTGGKTLPTTTLMAPGGTLTLQDNFTCGSNDLTVLNGTLDANNKNVTCAHFLSNNTNTRTITMGSGTWTLSGTSAVWDFQTVTGLTLNANTSTITISDTGSSGKIFWGGGKTYSSMSITGSGSGAVTINGSNTWTGTLTINAPKTVSFQNASTQTFSGSGTLSATGSGGNIITINSTVNGVQATFSKASGSVTVDYVSIKDNNATGGIIWTLGANSSVVSNVTGWSFTFAAKYAVATGNWSSTGTWSDTDGGASGATVPNAGSRVYLTATSGAVNVTVDVDSACYSLDCTGFTGTLTISSTKTLSVGNANSPDANVTFATGMTFSGTGDLAFVSTYNGPNVFTSKSASNPIPWRVSFNGSGGAWSITDTLKINNTLRFLLGTVYLYDFYAVGGPPAAGITATVNAVSSGAGTRALFLGNNCIINLTGTGTVWDLSTATGLTFSQAGSTINITDTSSSSKTFTGLALGYATLNITAGGTGTVTITGGNSWETITLNGPKTVIFAQSVTQTISQTLTINSSNGNVVTLQSGSAGTAAGLNQTGAGTRTTSFNWISVKDITASGGTPWRAGPNATNVSGNTGWTFWVQRFAVATGLWSSTGTWAATSGGASGVSVPTANDDVFMDAASGAITVTNTGGADVCNNLTLTGFTGTWAGANNLTASGSVVLAASANITFSAVLVLAGTVPGLTFTSNGKTFTGTITITIGASATLTFTDALTLSGASAGLNLTATTGAVITFNANVTLSGASSTIAHSGGALTAGVGVILSAATFNSFSGTRTINAQNARIDVTGTSGTVLNVASSFLTVTGGFPYIVIKGASAGTRTLAGGGVTFVDMTIEGGGTGAITVTGSNTFSGTLAIGGPQTVSFTTGTTTTFTSATPVLILGTDVANRVAIQSTSAGVLATWSKASGTLQVDYVTIKDNQATGGATFKAMTHSSGLGNTPGWSFFSGTSLQSVASLTYRFRTIVDPLQAVATITAAATVYDQSILPWPDYLRTLGRIRSGGGPNDGPTAIVAVTTGVTTVRTNVTNVLFVVTSKTVTVSSVVDSKGNTYAVAASSSFASGTGKLFVLVANGAKALVSGNTISVTFSGNTQYAIEGIELTGLEAVPVSDGTNTATGSGTSPVSAAVSLTTTYAKDILLGAIAVQLPYLGDPQTAAYDPISPYWTPGPEQGLSTPDYPTGNLYSIFYEWQISRTVLPFKADGTVTGFNGTAQWAAAIVAFKASLPKPPLQSVSFVTNIATSLIGFQAGTANLLGISSLTCRATAIQQAKATLVGVSGLVAGRIFTLWVDLGLLIGRLNSYASFAQVNFQSDYDKITSGFIDKPILDGLVGTFATIGDNVTGWRDSLAAYADARLLDEDRVQAELHLVGAGIDAVIDALADYMYEQGATIKKSVVTVGAVSADIRNHGDGTVLVTTVLDGVTEPASGYPARSFYNGLDSELAVKSEVMSLTCIADSEVDGLDVGAETFQWNGQATVDPLSWLPQGSGSGPVITSAAGDAANKNGVFEDWTETATGSGVFTPDNWTFADPTPLPNTISPMSVALAAKTTGTTATPEKVFRGTFALQIMSNGIMLQDMATAMVPRRRYSVSLRVRSTNYPAGGTLTVKFAGTYADGTPYVPGSSEKVTINTNAFADDWRLWNFWVNTPGELPDDWRLVVIADSFPSNLQPFIDDLIVKAVDYHGGVGCVFISGAHKTLRGDQYTFRVDCDEAGKFSTFVKKQWKSQLPSSASPTVADSLAN